MLSSYHLKRMLQKGCRNCVVLLKKQLVSDGDPCCNFTRNTYKLLTAQFELSIGITGYQNGVAYLNKYVKVLEIFGHIVLFNQY